MTALKSKIRESGLPVMDYYPAKYGGVENGDGVVAVTDLQLFSDQVYSDLWGAIDLHFTKAEAIITDPWELERTYHQAFVQQQTEMFVGRKEILGNMTKFVEGYHNQLMVINGSAGDGGKSDF